MTLSVNNLAIQLGDTSLFSPVSFDVCPGEVFSLMGPSGCGKSTLLSAIAGHLVNDFSLSGDVTLNERSVIALAPDQRKIGLLFQDDLLFPHLSVLENLMFGIPRHYRGEKRVKRAESTLATLGLSQLANKQPSEISGGQRARISLMRMLLSEPQAVLLDEPFSKLDKALRNEFRQFVFDQINNRQIPTIMVTHDRDDIPLHGRVLDWPWTNAVQEQQAC
ncbi:ATP-binding cassette domain-containing protein [Photobacterium lutimaris]|uniref:ABC transporter ATP-binding protein n=1 Tax=Photobacterium lutimaris TaxID=388278 RepID=A0A2T3J006_9GAMM|nr:ATP-binding cassette domain-containing protein [Photobacterium lutimaris]PSU34278.1 ABC transporter ATP-binding protein [Photobacterium lutimaris]TDR75866.1 putative thiamine transport system ATP-binding protein [Photobacterium lutimaris]